MSLGETPVQVQERKKTTKENPFYDTKGKPFANITLTVGVWEKKEPIGGD